jgi:hypothetical protein
MRPYNYPEVPIEVKYRAIPKTCRICNGTSNLIQDPLTKDWWHRKCRDKIYIITEQDRLEWVDREIEKLKLHSLIKRVSSENKLNRL